MRLSFGIKTSIGNMHKSVVCQTGVGVQQAAHYGTCIHGMKKKEKKVKS